MSYRSERELEGRGRFNRGTPHDFAFRDPRFGELVRCVIRDELGGMSAGAQEAGYRYGEAIIRKLRDGELPLIKISPAWANKGLTAEQADRIAAAIVTFAGDHLDQLMAAAAAEKDLRGMLDVLDPAAGPAAGGELSEMFGS